LKITRGDGWGFLEESGVIFRETKICGIFEIEVERKSDDRGFFARSWCRREFEDQGLNSQLAQCSVSSNNARGTLRGMHYQAAPHAEAKLIRCTQGSIFDVAIDLRPASPTFKQWTSAILTSENHQMLYVPEGCAHGFLTLEDHCEVFYLISEYYAPEVARGVRWDDPAFSIVWPAEVKVISSRDASYPDFT
jgi:dTDP-4-dehydrorhamnose 3,5-epimerase